MCDKEKPCMNVQFGFNCMVDWQKKNPGKIEFHCEYCGIYTASRARCNRCKKDTDTRD